MIQKLICTVFIIQIFQFPVKSDTIDLLYALGFKNFAVLEYDPEIGTIYIALNEHKDTSITTLVIKNVNKNFMSNTLEEDFPNMREIHLLSDEDIESWSKAFSSVSNFTKVVRVFVTPGEIFKFGGPGNSIPSN